MSNSASGAAITLPVSASLPVSKTKRHILALPIACLTFALLAIPGCNRGDHPQQVSQAAPDFQVHDAQHSASLSQFRGHVVILNFWATWCPTCLDELPSLQELQKTMPQVQVLAVSIDDDEAAYQQFLKQYDLHLLSIRDGSQGANLRFGSVRVPESFVVDRNGVIRRKFIGAVQWTSPEILDYLSKL